MDNEETENSTLRYLDILQQHASDFASHLLGSVSGRERLKPSFFPPSGFWTVGEKDAFFHSLSVHSRFRPDLIAADLPGKSLADVCSYLDLLAEATSSAPKLKQALSKPAYESTPQWMEAEESHARLIISKESEWDAEDRTARRTRLSESERRAMSHLTGSRLTPVMYRAEHRRVEEAMQRVRVEQRTEWDREDFTLALDLQKLKAMDYISLESEHTRHRAPVGSNETDTAFLSGKGSTARADDENPEETSVGVAPSGLSPALRRRYAKKMYMRRKRAEKTGQPVSESFERPKHAQKHLPPSQGQKATPSFPRPPSVTLVKQFASVSMTNAFFESTKLEILNFQAIGDLMRLYGSAQGGTDSEPTISLSTIQLLHAELLYFLTNIIMKCINRHEQECLMKNNSEVWRSNNDKVKATTVQEVLEMLEFGIDRQSFFSNFEARMDSFMVDENLGSANDEGENEDGDSSEAYSEECEASVDEEEIGSVQSEEMNHKWLPQSPSGIPLPLLWHSSLDHVQPNPYSRIEDDDDTDMIMPSDEDEEEYYQTLLADEKVDEADAVADKEAQISMWNALAGRIQNEEDAKTLKGGFPGFRLLEPDAAPGIKSNVYIDDSD